MTSRSLINQKSSFFEMVSRPAEADVSLATKGSERYPVLIADKREVSSSNVDVVDLSVVEGNREAIDWRVVLGRRDSASATQFSSPGR